MTTNGNGVINVATGQGDPERVTVAFLVAAQYGDAGGEIRAAPAGSQSP